MPKENGTGPDGQGSRTGRGLGRCGQRNDGPDARGLGRGRGCGMGRRAGERQTRVQTASDVETLEEDLRLLKQELVNLKQALSTFSKEERD